MVARQIPIAAPGFRCQDGHRVVVFQMQHGSNHFPPDAGDNGKGQRTAVIGGQAPQHIGLAARAHKGRVTRLRRLDLVNEAVALHQQAVEVAVDPVEAVAKLLKRRRTGHCRV